METTLKKVEQESATLKEIELNVEELEEVIAPKIAFNHSETLANDEVELCFEEVEEVIAPKIAFNHNETLASDDH
jgi:hypothetical protein